jgi:hypothetical protein
MTNRTIKKIIAPNHEHVGHLVAYNFSGKVAMEEFDPFLFLAHHGPQEFGKHNQGMPFAPHPHRGFETVTFIFQGDVMHGDSHGINSVIKEGGVQWMTAGRGIVHNENNSREFRENGGTLDIIQLWINLPAQLKMTPARYQGLNKEDIPVVEYDNGKVKLQAIAGTWNGTKGPAESITDIDMSTIAIEKSGKFETEVDPSRTILLYILKGKVKVNGKEAEGRALVLFGNEGSGITIEAESDAFMVFGSGKPYHEPIAAYGPFVMNNMTEIMEAQRDYMAGKMGVLTE